MENTCMDAKAFKPSLRPEALTNQTTHNDFAPAEPASFEDYFSVDSFLDIPAGVDFPEERGNTDEDDEKDSSITSLDDCFSNVSSVSFLNSALPVPDDDLAELEWVSHFVDDSEPTLSLLVPSNDAKTTRRGSDAYSLHNAASSNVMAVFPCPVPVKARSKRVRSLLSKTWSTGCPFLRSKPSLSFVDQQTDVCEPVYKRLKVVHSDGSNQFQRRCSHCQVQKTPQWRAGPLGPKTLCNACGVRYKSGRLFPEYRPACSPSFSSGVHSNSHRKVLEMRKRKQIDTSVSRFNRLVPIF